MNHESFATRVDTIAMAAGILSGLVAAGAALTAPTGLTAFGIWLGLLDEPWLVRIAPYMDILATASGALSGCCFFVVQLRKRKQTSANAERQFP